METTAVNLEVQVFLLRSGEQKGSARLANKGVGGARREEGFRIAGDALGKTWGVGRRGLRQEKGEGLLMRLYLKWTEHEETGCYRGGGKARRYLDRKEGIRSDKTLRA